MQYEAAADADIALFDGRTLAYCEWGKPEGRPMFLFHGAPGSRVFGPNSSTTADHGIRLITVDRPGYGRSDPKPGREILDWPDDITQLADALEVDEFDVVGGSSGGPYALACAYRLPDRVQQVVLVSCIAPFEEPAPEQAAADDDAALTAIARQDPAKAAAEIAKSAAWLAETPERFLDLPRPEPDARLLADPDIRDMFMSTMREAVSHGIDAYAWDVVLERRPWNIPLGELAADVCIFHGEQDRAVPLAEARMLSAAMPTSRLRLFPDAGHGLLLAEWARILSELPGTGRTGREFGVIPELH